MFQQFSAIPIRDADGIIGVVGIDIMHEDLFSFLDNEQIEGKWTILLPSSDGETVSVSS